VEKNYENHKLSSNIMVKAVLSVTGLCRNQS